jgi:hypothetical protein
MSNSAERQAEDIEEAQNDPTDGEIPSGDVKDDTYSPRTGQSRIPVQSDSAPVEDPITAPGSNSDEQLGKPISLVPALRRKSHGVLGKNLRFMGTKG